MTQSTPRNLPKMFVQRERVNWWRTPPESPDCNPIENLWHELKEFIRREVKPINKQELVDGIYRFRETLTIDILGNSEKLPKVVERSGDPTGY